MVPEIVGFNKINGRLSTLSFTPGAWVGSAPSAVSYTTKEWIEERERESGERRREGGRNSDVGDVSCVCV